MKNQSKLRLLILAGIFALLSLSLSSCFYSGYAHRDRYHSRPYYGYRPYVRPQVRVYVAPPRRYSYRNIYNRHRNYGYQNRSYRGDSRGSRSHGRR
ncbi:MULTISPECIES: hypothetical protein [Emticicia]|uniref:hypothetical protein n=1 Tax=Emticicia TaxID=312278 RepID=UPI0012E90FD9|nr:MULTISPECIES: hypothetical protein [Emticicia]